MFKYTLLAVICVTVFYHQSLGNQMVESTKDDVIKAFYEFIVIKETQAQDALNKAAEAVKAKAVELETLAKGQLEKILDPLRNKLNNLMIKAKVEGIDISKCQPYVDKLSHTPDDVTHNLIDCSSQQMEKARNYVNDALNNIRKIEQIVKSYPEIEKCDGSNWKQAVCYAKLLEKIIVDSEEATLHIAEDIAKVTALIAATVPTLEACFATQLTKAGIDATKFVIDFAVCAADPVVSHM